MQLRIRIFLVFYILFASILGEINLASESFASSSFRDDDYVDWIVKYNRQRVIADQKTNSVIIWQCDMDPAQNYSKIAKFFIFKYEDNSVVIWTQLREKCNALSCILKDNRAGSRIDFLEPTYQNASTEVLNNYLQAFVTCDLMSESLMKYILGIATGI